jgi:malonyl-CoA/methylmalonyl-CoA synthetase
MTMITPRVADLIVVRRLHRGRQQHKLWTAMNANLYAHFRDRIDAGGHAELLATADNRRYTYAQADRESARIAAYLAELGIRPGDRVSVQAPKSPQALFLYLACLRLGAVYHPLNTGYRSDELRYFFSNAEPSLIVCDVGNAGGIETLAAEIGIRHVRTLDGRGEGSLMDGARQTGDEFGIEDVDADQLAALLYSSGTTGVPKGIMLSHGNLLANTQALIQAWGFSDRDRLLHALPIFHVHGLFVGIGCVLASGASMRWLERFDAETVLRYLPECTVMMGVPTFYTRLLARPELDATACSHMRVFISGSAPLLEETFTEFEARTGHRILERYGMTETNMNTSNPLDGVRKPGTVGPPLPGVEVRVVDDRGKEVGTDVIGDLQVRGPNVFRGYWKLPEKTAEDFTDDGYFDTGDKARIDADGYVAIVGRSKDVVITGGLNVYPKEVELVIDELDGIRESAVIGVPHPDFGEAVVAVVVADPGRAPDEATVIAAAREKLADFKVPKRVIMVDELPRNTMAKVQKSVLRERHNGLFREIDA